jgi:hypothetical protein
MSKSSKQIEEDAIDYLKMALKKSKHINREISEGDKEPIWDGHIYFYKDTERRNIDFVERIPVQVKGNDDNYKENVGYSISRNNLEHYLTEGGVLYFVVYLKDDSPTVTYASLTPKAIKKILLASDKKKKGRIKNISIRMKPLPTKEDELNFLFLNFIQKRKYQKGFAHIDWRSHESIFKNSESFDGELEFKFVGKDYLAILDNAITGELDLYYKPKGASVPEPLLDEIAELQLFEEKEMRVQIQGKERLYRTTINYKTRNDYTVDFKNGCSIKIEERPDSVKRKLSYSLSNTLSKRLDGLEFILEVYKNKGITINGKKLNFSKENIAKIDFDFLNEALNANIRLKELVDELKISKELDSKGWSKKDSRIIKILYDGLINKQIVSLDRADYNFIQVIPFANVHVLLFLIQERENSTDYRIYNYSDYDMMLINEDRQQFSKYEAVDLDQLILVDNFNIDDYISSYLSIKDIENLDLGLLKLINYADSKSDRNILQTCLKFAQKMVDTEGSENNLLNLLQIKKRLNNLTQKDNNYLHSLMAHNSVEIRFAAACILGYKDQARYLFDNEFSDEQKERFREYPIYYLLSR